MASAMAVASAPRRRAPRADGPDRLVRDHEAGSAKGSRVVAGQRARQLGADHVDGAACLTLVQQLAHAEDGAEAGVHRPPQLAADEGVGLAGVAPALGVAEDDPRDEPRQHRRAHLARVGAGELVVEVLGADADPLPRDRVADRGQADRRGADDPDDVRLASPTGDRAGQLAGVGGRGVHLPVGGNDDGSHGPIMPPPGHATTMRPARRGRAVRPAACRRAAAGRPGPRRRGGGRPTRSVRGRAGRARGGSPARRPARRARPPGSPGGGPPPRGPAPASWPGDRPPRAWRWHRAGGRPRTRSAPGWRTRR